jgi:hypothetical protein
MWGRMTYDFQADGGQESFAEGADRECECDGGAGVAFFSLNIVVEIAQTVCTDRYFGQVLCGSNRLEPDSKS